MTGIILAQITLRVIWMRFSWSIFNSLYQEGDYSEEKLAKNLYIIIMGNMVGHFMEILVEDSQGDQGGQGGILARLVLV